MKKILIVALLAVIVIGFCILDSYAYFGKRNERGKQQYANNFFQKTHIILKNKEELKLNDKQKEKIIDLKIETKKAVIKSKADIEITALDIKKELRQDKINLKVVNKLIDKKYDLKKERAKTLVASLAKLKDILSKEQQDMLEELRKRQKKEWYHHNFKDECPYLTPKAYPSNG